METLRDIAIRAAREAGEAVLAMRSAVGSMGVTKKDDASPLTAADLAADRSIAAHLAATGIPVVSEESHDAVSAPLERFWLVDPLDGTQDFVDGTDDFCTMVALIERAEPILAVIFVPASETLYAAERGKGAWIADAAGERPLTVHPTPGQLRFVASATHYTPVMDAIVARTGSQLIRRGSNGIKAGLIAEGEADYTFSPFNFYFWDVAAPQLIVEESGGRVSGISGTALRYENPHGRLTDGFVASNGFAHPAVLEAAQAVLKAQY